jgi:small GTP-binding protein
LDVWDTAGEEKFDSLTTYYCKGAQAAVICYDLTSKTTFDNLPHWVEKIKDQANDDCVICIVGNKCKIFEMRFSSQLNCFIADLVEQDPSQRKVTTEQGEEYAKSIGALFFEVSARSGANVEKAFLKAATDATKKVGGFEDHDKVNLKANKGKTTCC